jgi:heptose-I-phosphate ethanolaminephosphotransferase
MVSKISKIIFVFLSIITLFVNSLILHIAFHWGTNTISSRIMVASLSPKSESLEYLATYLSLFDVFILSYSLIGIYILYKLAIHLKHTYRIVKLLSLLSLLIITTVLFSLDKIQSIRPYTYIKSYISIADIGKIQDRSNYINNLKHDSSNLTTNLGYDKIIVIMGESANKNHMSAYNYNKKTTPFFDSLLQNSQSFKYNVIAPTNQTRYSVPIDLTDATVNDFNLFFTTKSIISIFKEYGYRTYWLSNQGKIGKHENYIATISNEADFTKIANLFYSNAKYDDVLIEYLDKLNMDNTSKEFYLIHLMGSHASYKKRYPEEEALFKNSKNIIEQYDNTIFYTDILLQKIYNKFKDSKLLFIYVSDHAEVVNINKYGHGYSPAYKDEYEIPLVVYSSLKNNRLNKLKNLNRQSIFNMESFNKFIEYAVGIDKNISDISTNSNVFTLDPVNIIDYNNLNRFKVQKSKND